MKLFAIFFACTILSFASFANDTIPAQNGELITYDDIKNQPRDNTECATAIFANALKDGADAVSESDDEEIIRQWIYAVFSNKDVLNDVLACPEIANIDEADTVKFMPIQYIFPGGREITINYETQPKILKQRLLLANKQGLPSSDPSPRIGEDGAVWTNIDPAWYAIMVTEHGALDKFIGDGNNNTISLDYIKNNIDSLYPSGRGGNCTDRSAKSRDSTVINTVMRDMTVNIKDDTNDYYVAGDVNLQWLSYLEIALDVALTVVTFGGSQAITGTAKAARASRALKNMSTTLKSLRNVDKVQDYVKLASQLDKANDAIKKLDKTKDAVEYAKRSDEIKDITKRMSDLEKADDRVKQFKQTSETFADLNKYRNNFRNLRGLRGTKQTGNIAARAFKAFKSVNSGTKKLDKAARVARKGMKSGRINDWLFHSTMKNIGALGKVASSAGVLYFAIKFLGDMYDWTETSTGDFTNNIEFAPLLLLSADDLQGQENVVNHGMWLMWAGSSVSPTDDDAAYLQAMDFASKFHQDLVEYQDGSASPCNVDIHVVRPIIRDPGTEHQALYYLIMTDEPWSTADTSD